MLHLLFALGVSLLLSGSAFAASNCVVNLSHYDMAVPDFAAMKRDGVLGVIHESTYPPSVPDAKYASRQAAATAAGLLWGAYHFANASDPVRQADFFINVVSRNPPPGGVLMVLDFEKNGHYPGGTMTPAQAATFVQRVKQRTGKYPGLYSNENRVDTVLGDPALSSSTRDVLSRCWLWIANYHYIPRKTALWNRWMLWQYTGDGICDLPRSGYPIHAANVRNAERNMFNGSRGQLSGFWQENAWTP
jgi:lysozyme